MTNLNLLRQFISYDPESGHFTRHTRCRADNESALGVLTNKDSGGYVIFSVLGSSYLAHRLAFTFMGFDTPEFVDHINGIRHDNRWCNLRPANKFVNAQNRSRPSNNVSGHKGVIFDKNREKFRTYVRVNGKSYTAGRFTYFNDAVEAIEDLKSKLLGETYVSRDT